MLVSDSQTIFESVLLPTILPSPFPSVKHPAQFAPNALTAGRYQQPSNPVNVQQVRIWGVVFC